MCAECAHLHLDVLGAAKGEDMDGGFAEYSLVGRIDDVIEKRVAEAEERQRENIKNSLLCIRDRAAYFMRKGSECRPRKSAVAACTWIVGEVDAILNAGGKGDE